MGYYLYSSDIVVHVADWLSVYRNHMLISKMEYRQDPIGP
jgi:hypothetical protein